MMIESPGRWRTAAGARWRTAAVVAAAGAVLLLVACDSLDDTEAVSGVTRVQVEDNSFSPPVIEVAAGTEVTWEFAGRAPHDVVGDGWGSDVLTEGEYQHTFTEPGSFDYTCTLHHGMDGRVIVTDEDPDDGPGEETAP